jgi:hypothetical protein
LYKPSGYVFALLSSYAQLTNIKLSPDYVGVELGIGESLLVKAIAESTGRSLALIKADLKKEGDLGLVAMVSDSSRIRDSGF